MLAQLKNDFPEDLRVVFRHFPLINIHDKAALAAQAAEAAGEQGQFWAMHDLLFQRQQEWAGLSEQDFQTWLAARAAELGLDAAQFSAMLTSQANADYARQKFDEGVQIGLPGTPFLLINGRIYDGPINLASLSTIVRLYALQKQQFTACPPVMIDPDADYTASIQTEKGDILVELFPDQAPLAVNNFIFLASQGWYDQVTFHRVLPGQIAQAGDPSGTGYGGPGYAFVNEISDLKFDAPGLLAMANAGPDTNGSQFFITLSALPLLDGQYTIFGRVLEGMEVVSRLTPRDTSQDVNAPPGDLIFTITIMER